MDYILQRIAEQAWHLVGRHNAYTIIRLVENEIAKVVAGYPPNELTQMRPRVPEIDLKIGVNGRIGVTGRAIKTGASQLVNDVNADGDYIPSDTQIQSELAVPIILGERVIGVINVDSPEHGAFDEDDQQTLISLASYAAIAINNAQFLERTQVQAETLGGLYAASQVITQTLKTDDVLKHIVEQALRIVRANTQLGCFGHIALLNKAKLRFVAGFPSEILDDLRINAREIDLQKDVQKGITGHVALTGQSQRVDEVLGDANYIPFREDIKIHSQLSVPLKIGERILGVLSIEHPMQNAFGLEDQLKIELLASQASVAIQNAQQYEKLQKTYQA
ncbi:MAG TPA: GAF domain-containing protein, partial [Anaerolineales bacterium]|nr:GAF domain-containing protein [Anaerolineales bacterium]